MTRITEAAIFLPRGWERLPGAAPAAAWAIPGGAQLPPMPDVVLGGCKSAEAEAAEAAEAAAEGGALLAAAAARAFLASSAARSNFSLRSSACLSTIGSGTALVLENAAIFALKFSCKKIRNSIPGHYRFHQSSVLPYSYSLQ